MYQDKSPLVSKMQNIDPMTVKQEFGPYNDLYSDQHMLRSETIK